MTPKDLWSVPILHELSGLLNAIGYLSRFPDPGHALVWLPVNTVDSDHGFQGSFLALLHPPVTKCEISLNLSPQLSVFLHAFFLSPSISPISLISPTSLQYPQDPPCYNVLPWPQNICFNVQASHTDLDNYWMKNKSFFSPSVLNLIYHSKVILSRTVVLWGT